MSETKGFFTVRRAAQDAFNLIVEQEAISLPAYADGDLKSRDSITIPFAVMYGATDVTTECQITAKKEGDDDRIILRVSPDNRGYITIQFSSTRKWSANKTIYISLTAIHPQHGSRTSMLNVSASLDGQTGDNGVNALSLHLNADTVTISTTEGNISEGAMMRQITGTIFAGGVPLTTNYVSHSPQSLPSMRLTVLDNGISLIPYPGTPWQGDQSLDVTFSAMYDGALREMTASIAVVGSAQGQSVQGAQGASITGIKEYYRRTTTQTPPAIIGEEDKWSLIHLEPTPTEQYVWNYESVEITDPLTTSKSYQYTDAHLCCSFADGLISHTSLYLVTNTKTTPEETDNWLSLDDAMLQFSDTNRFFWNKEALEYKDTRQNTVNIRLVAVWGEKGKDGKDGEDGKDGYKGAKPQFLKWSQFKGKAQQVYAGVGDEEFYSIVYDDVNKTGWYIPRHSHITTSTEVLTDESKWVGSNMEFVATSIFFAQMAYVENLGVRNVLISDGQTIHGGFCATDDNGKGGTLGLGNVRLWLGSDTPQNAPIRMYYNGDTVLANQNAIFHSDGSITLANGNIVIDPDGNITMRNANLLAASGTFTGGLIMKFDAPKYVNGVYVVNDATYIEDGTKVSSNYIIKLPSASTNIGKRIVIYNPNYVLTRAITPYQYTRIQIEGGYPFYGENMSEDIFYPQYATELEFAGGIIEFLCVKQPPTAFQPSAWIVLNKNVLKLTRK